MVEPSINAIKYLVVKLEDSPASFIFNTRHESLAALNILLVAHSAGVSLQQHCIAY